MKDFQKYLLPSSSTIKDALIRLNALSSDILTLFVIDEDLKLLGTLTDGDVRRGLIKGMNVEDNVLLFIRKDFVYFNQQDISLEQVKKVRERKINLVPVLSADGTIERIYDFTKRKSVLPIEAILMAGGRGERLRPLTDTIPKPMLPIAQKPILEHNIDQLMVHGIESFHISVNYLADQIIDYFGDGHSKGINIKYVREDKPLGTLGAASLIEVFSSNVILVMNSDLFTNLNYEDFYVSFINDDADMSVASISYPISIPYAILNHTGNVIQSFEEKPTYTYHANAGIYLIKKELLKFVPKEKMYHATDLIRDLIERGYKITTYPILGYWVDIGRYEDYIKVQELSKHINL